jgi:ligand-binding sensor domain-containing protein
MEAITKSMKKNIQIIVLLLSSDLITSCSGQVKSDMQQDIVSEQQIIVGGQPKITRTQGITSGNLHCNLQDKAGNIWFSTSGEGVYRYDGKSFTNFTKKDGLSDNDVGAIIEDKTGNILFGTKSGICKYDGKYFSNYTNNVDPSKKSISSLIEDSKGNLWFGAWGEGVYRYDGKIFTNFLNKDAPDTTFPLFPEKDGQSFNLGSQDQLILDILEDKNGNIWFSSWNGGGVWQYDGKSFKNYLPSADYYQRKEDGRSGEEQNLSPEPAIFKNSPAENIADDMIFSISEDKAGNLWFATRRHGACRYDGKSFTSFREHEGFVSYGIYSILEDKKGNMWFSTEKNGVFSYDGKSFKNYTTADGLVYNSVFSILEDKNGNLWFGTRGFGLSRYDGKTFVNFSE